MNQENQTFNPNITPREEMKDFVAEADTIEGEMLQNVDTSNETALNAGVEVPTANQAHQPQPGPEAAQAYLDAHADDDLERPDRQGRLAALALTGAATVATVALGMGSGEAPSEPAPDPQAQIEDVATTPEGSTVEVVDAQYADFPSDARNAEVIIGGDANNDGYIDDTNPAMPGNQATIEK